MNLHGWRLLCGVKLFEVSDESLPWQICIIVAITNAIITGVGAQNREGEEEGERKAEGVC